MAGPDQSLAAVNILLQKTQEELNPNRSVQCLCLVLFSPAVLPVIKGSGEAPKKISVAKAGEITLECEAGGSPQPTVTWMKDGQPVVNGEALLLKDQGWKLHIQRAQVTHAGRYTCLAANAVGQVERTFDLAVHGKDAGSSLALVSGTLGERGLRAGIRRIVMHWEVPPYT